MGELPNTTPQAEPIRSAEQVKGPELLGFRVTEQLRTVSTGGFFLDEGVSDLEGRSLQEVAETADRRVVGISTQKMAAGRVKIGGQTIELTSQPFDRSGTMWVDGEVLTLEDVKSRMPTEKTLIANMESNGWSKVVKTRAGSYQPFLERDSVISSVPKSEAK